MFVSRRCFEVFVVLSVVIRDRFTTAKPKGGKRRERVDGRGKVFLFVAEEARRVMMIVMSASKGIRRNDDENNKICMVLVEFWSYS